MVNSINGILSFKTFGAVGIDTGSVEWAIETTSTTVAGLPAIGTEVRLYTHLHQSQDAMRLYGFHSVAERSNFLALISVNGLGPAMAKKILSGTSPDNFSAAIEAEDVAFLSAIPGLGKKTAQKIILQLKGKLTSDELSISPRETGIKEIVDSLAAMGFDARHAAKAVSAVLEEPDIAGLSGDTREKEILRRAIVSLS